MDALPTFEGMRMDAGPDWQMLQYLEKQEISAENTLRKVYQEMVLTGKLDREAFNEIVYLTGIRADFSQQEMT